MRIILSDKEIQFRILKKEGLYVNAYPLKNVDKHSWHVAQAAVTTGKATLAETGL